MNRHSAPTRAISISLFLAAVTSLLPLLVSAAEVTYVGTIRDGISAPVAVEASTDQIATLQPYSSQLIAFTPDGTVSHRVDVAGEARGLARLGANTYAYCERKNGQLKALDLESGRQWVLLAGLEDPVDVVVAGGEYHVLDAGTRRIVSVDGQGRVTRQLDLSVQAPASLAWDGTRSAFHVFDQTQSSAHVVDTSGQTLASYCSFGSEGGTITRGGGVACDADGYVYIVDRYQGRIAVFDPDWQFLVDIVAGELIGAEMMIPIGVSVDADGTLYVASMEENCIHVFSLDKTSIPNGDLAAAPLFPTSAGSLPVEDVRLVASVAATVPNGATLSADFRILDAANNNQPVAEATGVAAQDTGTDNTGRLVGTATWNPGAVLAEGAVYRWQTRARVDDRFGAWSQPVTFSTRGPLAQPELEPNYPNPFNPQTTIAFTVPDGQRVLLEIYDLRGAQVWSMTMESPSAGRHTVVWDGRSQDGTSVTSGVYFYRLQTDGFEQTRKMVLVR